MHVYHIILYHLSVINLLYTCIEIIGNGESEKDVAESGERAMVSPYSLDDFVY